MKDKILPSHLVELVQRGCLAYDERVTHDQFEYFVAHDADGIFCVKYDTQADEQFNWTEEPTDEWY